METLLHVHKMNVFRENQSQIRRASILPQSAAQRAGFALWWHSQQAKDGARIIILVVHQLTRYEIVILL